MNESERYQYTFNRETGEPVGILDTWVTPSSRPGRTVRQSVSMPPQYVAALWLLLFVFAAGLYAGCLLFGRREEPAPTVVVCPAPGVQVAVLPAECGPPSGGVSQ